MKTVHRIFVRNALSLAVLAALTTPVLAEVDGWDFSGQNARSQALASDYKNLVDSYNIWVNPALVVKHSNRVDLNITAGTDGAGLYKTFGSSTVGAYLGRPSVSQLQNSGTAAQQPRNQFDLFYGWHGVVDLGVRLNVQAISDENENDPFTTLSPNAVTSPFTGSRTTFNSLQDASEDSANELNFAFGVADPAGRWDAAMLWGMPSAESTDNNATQSINETFAADVVTRRRTTNFSETIITEDDGAQSLGLTGRLINIGIPNSIITLGYQSLDYSSKGSNSNSSQFIDDVNTINTVTAADGDINETDNFAETTEGTFENDQIDLFFTKNFNPMPNTLVLATLGWTNTSSEERFVTNRVTNNFVDNFTGTVTNFTPFGTQTNTKFETSANAMPLILGFEGDVNNNWTLRAAVRKDLFLSTVNETTTETWATPANSTGPAPLARINTVTIKNESTRLWDTDTVITLGAGYKNGSLAIDAVIQKEFVIQGVDEGLASRISVTWSI